MAQTQNVAFNSARNGGGGWNSFWADAQRDKSFCDVKIKILEHHQTVKKIVSYNNLASGLRSKPLQKSHLWFFDMF